MNKETKELAKTLFIKRYKPYEYLNDKNAAAVAGEIRDCITVAELFEKIIEEEKK